MTRMCEGTEQVLAGKYWHILSLFIKGYKIMIPAALKWLKIWLIAIYRLTVRHLSIREVLVTWSFDVSQCPAINAEALPR